MSRIRLSPALLALFLAAAPMPAADERVAPPRAEEQTAAEKTIRQLFTREYANRTRPGFYALAVKLMQQGNETKDDPTTRYVLFNEAYRWATSAGNLDLALNAAGQLGKHYLVSGPALKAKAFESLASQYTGVENSKFFADRALGAAAEALDSDEYDSAAKLLKVASTAATNARSVPLISSVQARTKEADALKAEYEKFKLVLAQLKEKPDDPDANLTAGKYYCLQKGNWDTGLPHLAKGGDEKLKVMAAADLAKPTESAAQAEVGEEWLALSQSEKDTAAKHLKWRARHWFEKAILLAEGDARTKLEGHLKDIPPREGVGGLVRVNLSDMDELDAKVGHGRFAKGGKLGYPQNDEEDVAVKEKRYANALSTHPPSFGDASVKYKLGKAAQELRFSVAINDTARGTRSAITFKVLGDGKELWSSRPVKETKEVQDAVVSVAGVDVLELRVVCPGDLAFAHAVWLDPHVLTTRSAEPKPATTVDDSSKQFLGVWLDQGVAGDPALNAVTTIGFQRGMWALQIQYVKQNRVLGLAEGTDFKFADGKLSYRLHHVKKVAPHWEDAACVATASKDKLEVNYRTRGVSGTNTATRVRR